MDMSTQLQKNLAKNIVENASREEPLNKTELLVSSGYSDISAKASASMIMEQVGVIKELEVLGFTELNAKTVVSEILLNPEVEPSTRLRAADQVFKVKGSYAPEEHHTLNVNVTLDEKSLAIAKKYEQELKESL